MPKLLKQLLGAELVLGFLLAATLIFYDSGIWEELAPIAALLPIALCTAFWRRVPLADVALRTYCAVMGLAGGAFIFLQLVTIKTIIVTPTNLFLLVEAILATALFFVLRSAPARRWYIR